MHSPVRMVSTSLLALAALFSCASCGSGKTEAPKPAMVACSACNGTGGPPCTAQGCEQGFLVCPGKCLKLSEGDWVKHDDGLRWRRFVFDNGRRYGEWSERHLGEVIEIRDGMPVNAGKCPTCGGKAKVPCSACNGTGRTPCEACKGAKQVPAPEPAPQ